MGVRFVAISLAMASMGWLAGCRDSPSADANKPPVIHVGYVGHDHQLALYVAALEGEDFARRFGRHLAVRKDREVYDLMEGDTVLATLRLVKVGGAANMPNAMAQGQIQIGLGGIGPVATFVDKGQPLKVIAPLQADGDMLVMRAASPIRSWEEFVTAARAAQRPLRIGYKGPAANAKLIFLQALAAENIPYSHDPADRDAKVLLVHMVGEKNTVPMLAEESAQALDGVVINQPEPAKAEAAGVGRVVADLRHLPPPGAWDQHPCCVVAATEEVLAQHPQAVKAFLQQIALASQMIRDDPSLAIDAAVTWTGARREIEQRSVPTVTYLVDVTDTWRAGVLRWAAMMKDIGAFSGSLAQASPQEIVENVVSVELYQQALAELREQGHLRPAATAP